MIKYGYVPAVKAGTTKKLASLWRGPYTVVYKLSALNYHIQLPCCSPQPTHTLLWDSLATTTVYFTKTICTYHYTAVVRRQTPIAGHSTFLPDTPSREDNSRPDPQVTSAAPTRPQQTHCIPQIQ